LIVFLYLMAIIIANVLTASFAPLIIGPFVITLGTFLIGATFVLRDLVQEKHGRRNTYLIIILALILSTISSRLLGDTLWIVLASAVSFLLSETTDTEIYTRLRLPMHLRVIYSGMVSGVLDSSVFVMVGLSPLGAGFIPWGAVPMAIIGQIIVKTVMQLIGVGDLERFGGKTNRNCETCGKRMPLSVMSIYNPSTRCNRAGCNSENKFPLWEPSCGTQSK